jgi:hypothetical protein
VTPHTRHPVSRRDFLLRAGGGFGALALAALLERDARGQAPAADAPGSPGMNPLAPRKPHFAAKADAVIFLFMEGGPSALDLFDPKPELTRRHGQPLPASFGQVITPMGTGGNKLLASKRTFQRHGKSGLWFSDWLPHMAKFADDWAVVRSCQTDALNHVGGCTQMNTGNQLAGRPSLGSWVVYGLGSVNQNLPGFVVLSEGTGEVAGGPRNWGTGFMPPVYQGTAFRPGPSPILNLAPPPEVSAEQQKRKLDLIRDLNERHLRKAGPDGTLEARIASYELAFRMQAAAPEAVDLSKEPDKIKELYGLDRKETAEFGHRCLLARRLVERGVRFVQVYCGAGSNWDAHADIEGNHSKMCRRADQPTAALLHDLKQRGLLERTLVIWGGEFGRTPMTEGTNGRDHNPYGFSTLFCGGGVSAGRAVGTTDEFGLRAVEDPAHVHDLHATVLHLLGFDHKKLTFFFNGRDERATENGGRVVTKLFS